MPEKKEKYAYVTFRIDARFVVKVPVKEGFVTDEVLKEARGAFEAADLGDLEDIVEAEPVMVEDEDGNYIWEK